MDVDIIIPYAGRDPHRERAVDWVRTRYIEHGWNPIVAAYNSGPWCKARSVALGLRHSDAKTIVVADADVWVENLDGYVARVVEGEKTWACPHIRIFRFNEAGSAKVYEGAEPVDVALQRGVLDQTPYQRMLGGGLIVITREAYEACPLDPRFIGWGGEDHAWGYALLTLLGDRIQGREMLWHLWHPPAERLGRATYQDDSLALFNRYQMTSGNVEEMQRLVDEGRAWESTSSS